MGLEGKFSDYEFVCLIILVYGFYENDECRFLWDEICEFRSSVLGLILVMGDFNEVINLEECKKGGF